MKKIFSLLIALVLCVVLTVSAFADTYLQPDETLRGEQTFNDPVVVENGIVYVKSGASITFNDNLTVGPNGSVFIEEGASVTLNNGMILYGGRLRIAGKLEGKGGLEVNQGTVDFMSGGEINVCLPEDQYPFGISSTLSEGSVTVVLCVACAVVFGLGGFILGTKKKKPALAEGENKDEE